MRWCKVKLLHLFNFSPQCIFKSLLKSPASSAVCFKMCPQSTCIRGCKITLVALVWLFSTVGFQMSPQIACLWRCKVTLVAFVWFFSTVCFQMSPQFACPRGCIVTLVAFVWFFSTVGFQMGPQMACTRRGIVTLHYRLSSIKGVPFRFANFASHFISVQIFQVDFPLILSAYKYFR